MHTVVATLQEIIIPVFGGHKSDPPYQEEVWKKYTYRLCVDLTGRERWNINLKNNLFIGKNVIYELVKISSK